MIPPMGTNNLSSFPSLPYLYPQGGMQGSKNRLSFKQLPMPKIPTNKDGVSNFFENLVEHVNRQKNSHLPLIRRSHNKDQSYDPHAPLITSDIYVSEQNKNSMQQTMVTEMKSQLTEFSEMYRAVIKYKKPKLLPLLPVPEFRHTKPVEKVEEDVPEEENPDYISEDELVEWDYSKNKPKKKVKVKEPSRRNSKKSIAQGSVKTSVKSKTKKKDPPPPSKTANPGLANAWKEFRMAVEYIKFCNYLFRYYRYQIKKCYSKTSEFLKENYPKALEDISKASFTMVKNQMLRLWLSIFSESNLNVTINKQLLNTYGFMDPDDMKSAYTEAQKKLMLASVQPSAHTLHVSSSVLTLDFGDRTAIRVPGLHQL